MIILFNFFALLMGIWSRPNIKESQGFGNTFFSFIIFAPFSVLMSTLGYGELNAFCFIPLILGFLVAHPFERWLAKELKKENQA